MCLHNHGHMPAQPSIATRKELVKGYFIWSVVWGMVTHARSAFPLAGDVRLRAAVARI